MEIILKETIDTLGQEGDIVKVKNGYARNFLIPRQKAVLVNKASLARLEREKQAIAARLAEQKRSAESMASRLEGKVVTISKRVGDENRLFGSVTGSDIALADAIKAIGEYKVTIKAGYQTTAQVQVLVVPETVGEQQ
jgi:large subunit ribosomal protein L9